MRVAVLDDWQGVARRSADWSRLEALAEVVVLGRAFADEDAAAAALAGFDVLIPMRERTPFTAPLIARLPQLRMIAQTGRGRRRWTLAACTRRGSLVCNTGGDGRRAGRRSWRWR